MNVAIANVLKCFMANIALVGVGAKLVTTSLVEKRWSGRSISLSVMWLKSSYLAAVQACKGIIQGNK